jgi:diacylglycerol kinase family enzyme
LDIVIVEETSLLEFLMTFPKVFKGTHLSHPKVKHYTAKTVTIESATQSTLLADGELYSSTPATFSIIEGAVPLVVPKNFEAATKR